jgi:hypothetical protein
MTVKDYKGGKLVILSKALDNRSKILNAFYFFLCLGSVLIFGILLTSESNNLGSLIILILGVIAFLIAAYRFGNKAVFSERLFITGKVLEQIQQGFTKRVYRYELSKISNFRHLDKPELTKHPLAGQNFDYLGFQTEQQVINELHGDKRLAFDYNGLVVTFGENIYTWDFDELEILLYDLTGNDLRYTDQFEKANFPRSK